jgi:hypothetical protein
MALPFSRCMHVNKILIYKEGTWSKHLRITRTIRTRRRSLPKCNGKCALEKARNHKNQTNLVGGWRVSWSQRCCM